MKTTKLCLLATVALVFAFAAGCGGGQKKTMKDKMLEDVEDDPDIVADLTGIDDTTEVDVEEEEQPEQAAAAAGQTPSEAGGEVIGGNMGAFLPTLKINGKEEKGKYTIRTADTENTVVQENLVTGTQVDLNPGTYDFVFTTEAIVGQPEMTLRDVEIPMGRLIKREVKIPTGQITLVTGGRCVKKPLKIRPKGASDWYPGKFKTCVPMILMAGEYEAEVGGGKRGTPISGIQVYDGGIRDVLIRKK